MPDWSRELVLCALERAVCEPGGLPLYIGRGKNGLFRRSREAAASANYCRQEGLIRPVDGAEARTGKSPLYTISPAGLAFLAQQRTPDGVIRRLVAALHDDGDRRLVSAPLRQALAKALSASSENAKTLLRVLGETHHGSFRRFSAGDRERPEARIVSFLRNRAGTCAIEDCPLPELYQGFSPETKYTIGEFHDALRGLFDLREVYLYPWTGPLQEIPDPRFALMVGHEIAYYARLAS